MKTLLEMRQTQVRHHKTSSMFYRQKIFFEDIWYNFHPIFLSLPDEDDDIPTMPVLQAGLLNEEEHVPALVTLAMRLVNSAMEDPGLPDDDKTPDVRQLGSDTNSFIVGGHI